MPADSSVGGSEPSASTGIPESIKVGTGRRRKSRVSNAKMVGGPGFEPGASRSRTLRISCPPVSRRFRQCPPPQLRRPLCPSVSFRVLLVPRMRDTSVTRFGATEHWSWRPTDPTEEEDTPGRPTSDSPSGCDQRLLDARGARVRFGSGGYDSRRSYVRRRLHRAHHQGRGGCI